MKSSIGTRISGVFFAAAAAGFIVFVFLHPLDWQQPETLRLHYYALQSRPKDGPLSSSLSLNDLKKPLAWKAQGGMFDGRYPIMLLDALIPKLYQRIYPLTGPFLSEPVNIALILASALMLFLLLREWFGSPPSALIASGLWLVSSQTLLDACYPVRPNMCLLVFLFLYVLWEMLRLRVRARPGGACLRIWLAFTMAWFTHEYALIFLPVLAIVAWSERAALKRHFLALAVSVAAAPLVYAVALLFVFPPLARAVTGEMPTMDWVAGGARPLIADPAILIERFRDFTVVGVKEMACQNLGMGIFLPMPLRVLGALASLALVAAMATRGWHRALPSLLMAVIFYLLTSLLMFPVIPPSVEMPVYYYAPIIALFMIPLGALLSAIRGPPAGRRVGTACLLGLVIGGLNWRQSGIVMEEMPGDFGFIPRMREYVRDILGAEAALRATSPALKVYTAYPRPRSFDISRRWDIMLRVWHGEAEQVFPMMMPVLNLRHYESGELIGSPDEFAVTAGRDPFRYEETAEIYWDMPRRESYDLKKMAAAAWIYPLTFTWSGTEDSGAQRVIKKSFSQTETLLGLRNHAQLPPGSWWTPVGRGNMKGPSLLVILVRADLVPEGPEEVMDRTEPLPLRRCELRLEEPSGRVLFSAPQTYGWSYQMFIVPTVPNYSSDLVLRLEGTAEAEVVGPLVLNGAQLNSSIWRRPYRGRFNLQSGD